MVQSLRATVMSLQPGNGASRAHQRPERWWLLGGAPSSFRMSRILCSVVLAGCLAVGCGDAASGPSVGIPSSQMKPVARDESEEMARLLVGLVKDRCAVQYRAPMDEIRRMSPALLRTPEIEWDFITAASTFSGDADSQLRGIVRLQMSVDPADDGGEVAVIDVGLGTEPFACEEMALRIQRRCAEDGIRFDHAPPDYLDLSDDQEDLYGRSVSVYLSSGAVLIRLGRVSR